MEDTSIINFTVYGEPVPWKRTRAKTHKVKDKKSGEEKTTVHFFEDKKVAEYKEQVVKAYKESGKHKMFPKGVPLSCEIYFWLALPSSASQKKRLDMACNGRPTKRPDNDNLYKGITDALNGIAYCDDSQIVDTLIHKMWTMSTPRAEVEIREIRR